LNRGKNDSGGSPNATAPSGLHNCPKPANLRTAKRQKKTFGSMLRAHRRSSRMSRNELATQLGLNLAQLALVETDRSDPSINLVVRSAKLLGFEAEAVFRMAYPAAGSLKRQAWKEFKSDKSLLMRHKIASDELRALESIEVLGQVTDRRLFVSILKILRDTNSRSAKSEARDMPSRRVTCAR
jgi:DNA-binding XRE family transcriptional regulator